MSHVLGYTADFVHIDDVLKERWDFFTELKREMESFVPRDASGFNEERQRQLDYYLGMNSKENEQSVRDMVEKNISHLAEPSSQFHESFWRRLKTEYVTVALISSALCEAIINLILAAEFATKGIPDAFEMIDKADIKQKWIHGPKLIYPEYELPKGGALYEALTKLVRSRNAFVHYKAEISINNEKVHHGSITERMSISEEVIWAERFFSLPYDLLEHIRNRGANRPLIVLPREKIPVAKQHRNA